MAEGKDLTPDPKKTLPLGTTPQGETDSASNEQPASADSGSVSNNAPTQDLSTTVALDVVKRSANITTSNVLDDYIDVIYNISLGMVSYKGLQAIQKSNVQIDNIAKSDYVNFASTAEAATDPEYTGNYCNIQNLVFTSFLGHLPQNPITAVIWDGKMTVFEPYGFNWREDMIKLAGQLGYPCTSMLDFVYRLEIWFSGYDPKTGQWKKKIDIPVHDSRKIQAVVYYLVITTAEAKVTPTGTFYQLSFQTVSHNATRAESIMMQQDSMPTAAPGGKPGKSTDGITFQAHSQQKFGDFLESLGNALRRQVLIDTQNQIEVTYKFYGLQTLFDAPFINTVNINFHTGVSFDTNSGAAVVSAKNVDIFTLVNQVMGSIQLVRDLLLREDNPQFTEPGVVWNIRTNISETQNLNQDTNTFKNFTFEYIFEPVFTFRSRTTEFYLRNTQVTYANQKARIDAMAKYGMIIRKYDYMFTPNNSEIIEFDLNFKNFYYAPFPYQGDEITVRGAGHSSADQSLLKQQADQKLKAAANQNPGTGKAPTLQFTVPPAAPGQSAADLASSLGIPTPPQSATNLRCPGPIFGYMHRGPGLPPASNATQAEKDSQKYLTARDQYLRYDMIATTMTIRFDPVWLLNPYMAGKDYTPTIPVDKQKDGQFCYAHTDKVIFINAPRPNQASFMNPNTNVSLTSQTPIMGGFFQVLYAINEFSGGRFVQKLNMYKYDHLNYANNDTPSAGAPQQSTTQVSQTTPTATQGVTTPDPTIGFPG